LLRPCRAIQLGGVAVQFNGLVADPVQTMAPPQFFLMRPSYVVAVVSVMSGRLPEFGIAE
jgi:hypothetical protein